MQLSHETMMNPFIHDPPVHVNKQFGLAVLLARHSSRHLA